MFNVREVRARFRRMAPGALRDTVEGSRAMLDASREAGDEAGARYYASMIAVARAVEARRCCAARKNIRRKNANNSCYAIGYR